MSIGVTVIFGSKMAWGIFKKIKDGAKKVVNGVRKVYEAPIRFVQNKVLKPAARKMKNLPGMLGDIGEAADKFISVGEKLGIT